MQEQKEQIGRNSHEIRTKFVRISYEFHISRKFTQIYSREIRTKFVRISYEFHVNFVQFANTQSKHTSKHTLHSHGQVMLHAPVLAHLGDRHAGTVFTRCHSVVGRPGGAMPDKAKWISDSASTSPPLATSSWCTLPTKNSMHWGPTSMKARSEAGADREMKVGWKGQVGGPAGSVWGGVGEEGLGSLPVPQPHPPNRPLPHPQHLVHAGEVPAGQIPSNVQGLLGGDGVQVCGVGLVVFVSGVGGPQVKKSPLQPILGVGEGRQSMMAAGGHHQQHVPPMQLNGVPARLHRLPQGRPCLHRHLVVL